MPAINFVLNGNPSGANAALTSVQQQLAATAMASNRLGGSLGNVQQPLQRSTRDFTGLSRVIQDLPFGFIGIQNNITQLLPAAGALGLVLSVVTSAITFAQTGTSNWTRGLTSNTEKVKDITERIKDLTEEQRKFNKESAESTSGAISQGIQLQKYVEIARDQTRSITERNTALSEANKILGEHGEKLTLVNVGTAAVTEEINKFTAAMIQQALATKYADRIADLQIKGNELSKTLVQLNANLNTNAVRLTRFQSQAIGETPYEEYTRRIKETEQEIGIVTKQIQETQKDFNVAADQSVNLISDVGVKATKEKVNQVLEYLRKLQIERDAVFNDKTIGDYEAVKKEFDLVKNAVVDLQKLKVPKKSTIIQKLVGDQSDLEDIIINFDLDKAYQNLRKLKPPADALPPVELPAFQTVAFTLSQAQAEATLRKQRDILRKAGRKVFTNQGILTSVPLLNNDEVNNNFSALQKNIQSTAELLQQGLNPLFDALFTTIANGSGNAAQAIGEAAKQMVLNLAKAAAEAAVLSLLLNALFPGSVAAKAGGFSFASLFQGLSGLPKFAQGGLVSGPVLGLIGEGAGTNPNNPEVVAPLDKLKQYIGNSGSGSRVTIDGRIAGNDILISQKRSNRSYDRINGVRTR